jgi:hypothetical protein
LRLTVLRAVLERALDALDEARIHAQEFEYGHAPSSLPACGGASFEFLCGGRPTGLPLRAPMQHVGEGLRDKRA